MRPFVPFLCHALIVIALTLLTQIGGVAYLIALPATKRWRSAAVSLWRRTAYLTAATVLIYAVASIAIIPPLAELLGREHVPCASTTPAGCALNRAYLKPKTLASIVALDEAIAGRFPGSSVTILE